jgi:hypothetical protein
MSSDAEIVIGLAPDDMPLDGHFVGCTSSSFGLANSGAPLHYGDRPLIWNGTISFTVGDVVGVAYSYDDGSVIYTKNGALIGILWTGVALSEVGKLHACITASHTAQVSVNFNGSFLYHDPPSLADVIHIQRKASIKDRQSSLTSSDFSCIGPAIGGAFTKIGGAILSTSMNGTCSSHIRCL